MQVVGARSLTTLELRKGSCSWCRWPMVRPSSCAWKIRKCLASHSSRWYVLTNPLYSNGLISSAHASAMPILIPIQTNSSLSRMVPAKLIAKYAFDAAKVAQQKKKVPLSKLLPVNATEKQFEKELNEAFAQVSSSMLSMHRGCKSIYQPCGHISYRKWASTTTPSENWSNLDTPEATLHSEFCC